MLTGKIVPLILVSLLLISPGCRNTSRQVPANIGETSMKTNRNTVVELLLGSGDYPFRNIKLGESPAEVQNAEKTNPEEDDTNYLLFKLPIDTLHPDSVSDDIDSLNYNYFTVAYNFDGKKLTDVDEDIFLSGDSTAAELYNRLSLYFTGRYGEGIQAGDSKIWSYERNGKKMNFSLTDQSAENDYGKLSLVFYCEDL